jgi:hypothetical protein
MPLITDTGEKMWNPYYEICNCTTKSIVHPCYVDIISIVWKYTTIMNDALTILVYDLYISHLVFTKFTPRSTNVAYVSYVIIKLWRFDTLIMALSPDQTRTEVIASFKLHLLVPRLTNNLRWLANDLSWFKLHRKLF